MTDVDARLVWLSLLFALSLGMGVVLLDKEYRPDKIAASNQGVFSHIPVRADAEPSDDMHHP